METDIDRLIWEKGLDAFVKGMERLAEYETKRKVINQDLKEWWIKVKNLMKTFPTDTMPDPV